MAEQYTPTTDQVRRYWQYGANAWREGHATDRDEAPNGSSYGAEFDRWLAEYRRQVIEEAAQVAHSHIKYPTHCSGCDMATVIKGGIRALAEKGADRG